LIWNSSFKCPTVSLKSVLHVRNLIPTLWARNRPTRMASYSTWLLEVLMAKCRDFSMRMSLGPSSTMSGLQGLVSAICSELGSRF